MDTLSDRNGKRDAYVRDHVEELKRRQELLREQEHAAAGDEGQQAGHAASARAAIAAAAAAASAELEEQMAAKRRRMLEASKAARERNQALKTQERNPPRALSAENETVRTCGPQVPHRAARASDTSASHIELSQDQEDSDDDVGYAQASSSRQGNKLKKRRRPGMF